MNPKEMAILCARLADQKKAEDIVILDVSRLIVITDYFLICSGTNERHVQSLKDEIHLALKNEKVRCLGIESSETNNWILMDFGDIVVHVYLDETRKHYDLEDFWVDAPRVDWKE